MVPTWLEASYDSHHAHMKPQLETPQDIRQHIWKELGRASQDRHHEWRTPVLATVGTDGSVNARTVVLREVNAQTQTLQIFTDARSSKVQELGQQAHAVFVFWSKRLGWQLRVRADISVQTSGPEVQVLWDRVKQSAAAADYLSATAPGSALTSAETVSGESVSADSNQHHFARLTAQVSEMDWLELGRAGHRRAKMTQDLWEWLTP